MDYVVRKVVIKIGVILPQIVDVYYKNVYKVKYVHVSDLPKSFLGKVKVQCDICGKVNAISYNKYNINLIEWMGLKPTQAISKKQSNRNYTQHAKRTK